MSGAQRPVSVVPFWICALIAVALGLQIAWQATRPAMSATTDLPLPPRHEVLRVASFGEEPALARLAMLYLQAFDYRARSEEHTSELQSQSNLVCRLLLEKKNTQYRSLFI